MVCIIMLRMIARNIDDQQLDNAAHKIKDLQSLADSLKQDTTRPVDVNGAGLCSSVPSSRYTGDICVDHVSSSSD